ncbi:Calx-beta domain-containing protein [Anabaena sp. PCC 7108]|uniref:Calx-beta domain-containing protein n=1 Tax=Anabaena sp. PCC 7108 TaxID=163908 RepID=UPI000348AED8|nr:Calx-beta domain-containing protein [Anabaena sp. PCC 7108]
MDELILQSNQDISNPLPGLENNSFLDIVSPFQTTRGDIENLRLLRLSIIEAEQYWSNIIPERLSYSDIFGWQLSSNNSVVDQLLTVQQATLSTVTISATDATAAETIAGQTANPGLFTLTRTGNIASSLTVNYTITGTATNGTDYQTLTKSVTFAAGLSTAIINLTPSDDTVFEGNETVILNLASSANYGLGTAKTATVNLVDNDKPTITISATDTSAAETLTGQTTNPGKFTLTRTGNKTAALTVNYSVAGTATNGTDYNTLTKTATFAAGSTTALIDVNVKDDAVYEGNETVIVTLASGTSYILGTTKTGTVNLVDNDKPTITISATDASAAETLTGQTANPGKFTLTRTGNKTASLTVNYTVAGTATNGTDYNTLTKTATFAAGSATVLIDVNVKDDAVYEGNETVIVTLASGTSYILGTTKTATVNLVDNDKPTITISATDASAAETLTGQTTNPGKFTLTRTGSTTSSLTVNYTVAGTATNGTDYNTLSKTATFAAGSTTALIDVNVKDDAVYEGNETVIVNLASSANYTLGTAKTATVTIVDNDSLTNIKPTITISATDANAGETLTGQTANPGKFTLTRTGSTASSLTVNYSVAGTATNGTDYNNLSGTATFAVGSSTTIINLNPINDSLVEGDEIVIVNLTSNTNYNLGTLKTATVTIVDNLPNHTGLINDINKDGKHDILWRDYNGGATHFWSMNGGTFLGDVDIPDYLDMAWHPVAMADFNNDGNMDIVWRYHWVENTGHDRIWLMDGNNRLAEVGIDRVDDNNWHIVGSGDFNLDGNADILWRNYATGQNVIWKMSGTTHTSEGDIILDSVTDLNQRIVGTGDFDGDAKSDILWRNAATGQLSIWFMNGTTKSSVQNLSSSADLTWSVAGTGDMNNDGKSDIIWRNLNTGENTVWLMNGANYAGGLDIPDVLERNWNIVGDSDQIPIWTAEYFGNKELTGTPTSTEGFINITGGFNLGWGLGAPPNTPVDNFSARYKTQQYLGAGLYKINVGADDSVRVWIGNELVIDGWANLASNRSGYFSSPGGYSPVTIEYKEEWVSAALNYEIVKYQPYNNFGDPNGIANSWNASYYLLNAQGTPMIDEAHRIGTVNLGSSVRGDGQWGMNGQYWGAGSPAANVPADFFAMHAYTRKNLEAGHTYKVWVKSDDGYRMWAHKLNGGAFNITNNALGGTFLSDAYGGKEFTFVAPESGTFDFHTEMFEGGGDAYFDLVVTDITAPPPPVWENPLPPGSYTVTQEFGNAGHTGIDLGANTGTRIEAARSGTVTFVGVDQYGGKYIDIDHGGGLKTRYLHLSTFAVSVGNVVNDDTKIGEVGSTGWSTGPHLHFEVWQNGVRQNPRNYIQF